MERLGGFLFFRKEMKKKKERKGVWVYIEGLGKVIGVS